MLHRKLIEPALAQLEGERATYFSQVLQRLDEDPRVDVAPNLVFLVLKEIVPLCPTYLPVRELVDRLLEFVAVNQARINRAIFDPAYIADAAPSELHKIGGEFINQILTATFKKLDSGELQVEERQVYRFSADSDPADFPYRDEDDLGET
jgi:hypothetical protein